MISRFLLSLALAGSLTACGDDDTGTDQDMSVAIPHNFKQINALILAPSCASFKSCHSQSGKTDAKINMCSAPDQPGLPMQICQASATLRSAYDALVGMPPVHVVPANGRAKGEGMKIVDPCKPENSFLLTKLRLPVTETDPKVNYGEHMPNDNPSLSKGEIDAISDWIARGAHFDEPDDVAGNTCVMTPPDLAVSD
jgi:hypothetical protein